MSATSPYVEFQAPDAMLKENAHYLCWCPEPDEPRVLQWIGGQLVDQMTGYAPRVSHFAQIFHPYLVEEESP